MVESTCRGEPRIPPRKAEVEPQSSMSVREAADVKKMIEEVLEQKKLVPAEEEQQKAKAPFTREVMGKPLPPKFKMPSLPTFSGKEDPYEHVQNYEAIMMLHGWDDAIMCRAFPITLKDHARSWFNGLNEASLSCFDQLRKEFINAFIINSKRKKDATYLLSVRQSEKETLRQYVDNTWTDLGMLLLKSMIYSLGWRWLQCCKGHDRCSYKSRCLLTSQRPWQTSSCGPISTFYRPKS